MLSSLNQTASLTGLALTDASSMHPRAISRSIAIVCDSAWGEARTALAAESMEVLLRNHWCGRSISRTSRRNGGPLSGGMRTSVHKGIEMVLLDLSTGYMPAYQNGLI
jgi:hypothetical protein